MSHISKVDVEIRDLECLKKACAELGLEFVEGQKTHKWYGQWVGDTRPPAGISPSDYGKCDHAIRIPNNAQAYEIGVARNPNGQGHVLLADFWMGGYGLENVAGKNCSKLTQNYIGQVSKKKLTGQGFQVQRQVLADGSIKLLARR